MTAHIHAELIKQYAEDATKTDKPWEWWEFSNDNGKSWNSVLREISFYDSIKYRRIDPYRELKEAAADPTKQIRVLNPHGYFEDWRDANWGWQWNLPVNRYEIRNKPVEKKKVKMWQWIIKSSDGVSIFTSNRFFVSAEKFSAEYPSFEVLGPALWTEIEVEE